jgi:MFS family permease
VRVQRTGLWRHPDFLKLWTGQTVSVFGSLITGTALPFTAILVLDASAFQVAVLRATDVVAGVLVGLAAGVWVDRLRRRPLMIAADVLRALLLVTIPLAWALDVLRIEHVFVVAFLTGVLTILFDVAYQSYLPTLVRREELVEGNSKLTASGSVAEFGAFSLGGWLVQLFTAPLALLIDAVSFLVSAGCLLSIRRPERSPPPPEGRASVRGEIVEGLVVVARHPVLRALAAAAFSEAMARGVIGSVVLLYLNRELGFGPGVLGMIFAVGGVTSLLGALAAGWLTRRAGIGPAMILGHLFTGLGSLFLIAAGDTSALAVVLLVANQCVTDPAATVADIASTSLRQSVAPAHAIGRVNAGIRFIGLLMTLVFTLLAGLLAGAIGLRGVMAIGVALNFLPALWLLLSPVRGMHAVMDGEDQPAAVSAPAGEGIPRA